MSTPCLRAPHSAAMVGVRLLLDDELIDYSRLHGHRQVTDAYLLALATANGGRFATLDQSIPIDAVRHASARNLTVI
ncbi:MAG: hypothetical protein ACLPXZ_15405 [Mycobacterium sp.]